MLSEFPHQFLVVSDSEEDRLLCARTLLRKFPSALILECRTNGAAPMLERAADLAGAVIHYNGSPEVRVFVENLRRISPKLPILTLSGFDRSIDALAAGTTRFLPADQWLLVAPIMHELLDQRSLERKPSGSFAGLARSDTLR